MKKRSKPTRDIVTIYEDPYTKTKAEGQAELVKFIGYDQSPNVERHLVHFIGDAPDQFVERTIVTDAGE
ncbi:MAG TPA: hypothetical protein VIK33_17460 [Anaerolineae bacterium]